jgi:hypothetical protein
MPLPESSKSLLLPALREYLEDQCLPYKEATLEGDIKWNYYDDDHSPKRNPQGLVGLPRLDPIAVPNRNYQPYNHYFNLRFMVSHADISYLEETLAANWRSLLLQSLLDLGTNGYIYQGVKLFQGLAIEVFGYPELRINQSDGGTVIFTFEIRWNDDGL